MNVFARPRRNFNRPAQHRAGRGGTRNLAMTQEGFLMPKEVPFALAIVYRIGIRQFSDAEAREERLPMPLPVRILKP